MRTYSVEGEQEQHRKRRGFFARILEALHRSRRREAIRVLRRHRHLIAGQARVRPPKSEAGSRDIEKSNPNAYGNTAPARVGRRTGETPKTRFA